MRPADRLLCYHRRPGILHQQTPLRVFQLPAGALFLSVMCVCISLLLLCHSLMDDQSSRAHLWERAFNAAVLSGREMDDRRGEISVSVDEITNTEKLCLFRCIKMQRKKLDRERERMMSQTGLTWHSSQRETLELMLTHSLSLCLSLSFSFSHLPLLLTHSHKPDRSQICTQINLLEKKNSFSRPMR